MIEKYQSFILFLAGTISPILFAEIRIETSFSPPTITAANTSIYKVVVHGSQQGPVGSLPQVKGLTFSSPPRTLRSASFFNGVPTVRFELNFTVKPQMEGTFVVPEWKIDVENRSFTAPTASLTVLPPSQKDKIEQAQKRQEQANLQQAAFLEFSCPRSFLFQGETLDANISLFLWDRLPVTRIEQIPQKKGSGISISELGQPLEQRNVKRFNRSYSVYSWNFALTGALIGTHQITFDSFIRVRVKNNRNSPFSSPFFNDPFFGFGREEGLKVSSNTLNLEIRPLPSRGRPSNFQGAIGNLSIRSFPDKDRVSVGDPVRLTCIISGTGNFVAIPAPKLALGNDFTTSSPAFSFEGNEATKLTGAQSFEYIITPLRAGLLEIPPVSFSYFNPESVEFISQKTDSHPLRVDPGQEWTPPVMVSQEAKTKSTPRKDLFQTESDPGKWIGKLDHSDPLKMTFFWVIQLILFLFSIILFIIRLKGRNPKLEARMQKEKHLESKLRVALKHNDVSGFHQALRRRIRLRIGIACDQANTSALSSSEIVDLLHSKGYSEKVVSEILEVLKVCDDMQYAAASDEPNNIEITFQRTQTILKKIK